MADQRVLKSRIGQMPHAAEVALANAIFARRMRHVARCNCGKGKAGPGCTTRHPEPEKCGEALAIFERYGRQARRTANAYRRKRDGKFAHTTGPRTRI